MAVEVARIHDDDPPAGVRVLVDRLWPRGVSKVDADLDEWCRDVAPSDDLRRWYGHDPDRHREFVARYQAELDAPERAAALDALRARLAAGEDLVLLTATRDVDLSHALILQEVLAEIEGSTGPG